MFTCSICDDTFVGIHQDTTYTTHCGHVFHYHCLITWLERSHTCPHCRSAVAANSLIKLFLQVDPNARVTWNKKVDEEVNSLTNQLKQLREKEKHDVETILRLETQLKQMQSTVEQNNKSIQILNHERENCNFKIIELKDELEALSLKNSLLNDQKKNLEEKCSFEHLKTKNAEKNLYELQSMNSVIIYKLKTEIADLKSEKCFLQSKCHNLENGKDPLPSTSKLTIEYKEIASRKNKTHEYYGHDHLNLSLKRFLLGCVFLINEDRFDFNSRSLICNNATMSALNIIEHGGSIDEFYSSRVTHIICTTQKDSLVEQSIRDKKRCVTCYWLSDTISKGSMSPPWLAHHFPTPFSKESGLPCQHLQIAISNFDINEYHRVKSMIGLTGAQVVDEVTSSTDVIISLKLEGQMVETALALNKPVVNVQWLNDILFGAEIGIKDPTNIKYQQFDLSDPFSVNYDMVSHLMEGWKTPVVYLKNQKVYDLTSPSKCKKLKTEVEDSNCIDLSNDDDGDADDDNLVITYINTRKPCVMFSGFTMQEREEQSRIVLQLGGTIATCCDEVTHLVMKQPLKTINFLCCLSSVKQIINELWLKESHYHHKFQDERKYFVNVIYDNNEVVCNIPKVLESSMRQKLFKSLTFFVTPGIKLPPPARVEEMIKSAGGTVESNRKSLDTIKSLPPNTYFIISCFSDLHLVDDVLKINYAIYKPEFITNSIMKQCIEIQHYTLSPANQN